MQKFRDRGDIAYGSVKSLTDFFGVPKIMSEEEVDITVLYDATKCGIKKTVLVPNVYLPIVDTLIRITECTSWFRDLDFGDFHLNSYLDPNIR